MKFDRLIESKKIECHNKKTPILAKVSRGEAAGILNDRSGWRGVYLNGEWFIASAWYYYHGTVAVGAGLDWVETLRNGCEFFIGVNREALINGEWSSRYNLYRCIDHDNGVIGIRGNNDAMAKFKDMASKTFGRLEPIPITESDEDHARQLNKTGYWGKEGAGVLFFCTTTKRFCLSLRSEAVLEPRTWGTWGGAIDSNESPLQGAVREAHEETRMHLEIKDMILVHENVIPDKFKYTTFIAIIETEIEPNVSENWEVDGFEWCSYNDWPSPLHHGMAKTLSHSLFKDVCKRLLGD